MKKVRPVRAHIMGQAQESQCIAKRSSPAFDATRFHPLWRSNAERGTFILCGTRNRDGRIFSRLYMRKGGPQAEMGWTLGWLETHLHLCGSGNLTILAVSRYPNAAAMNQSGLLTPFFPPNLQCRDLARRTWRAVVVAVLEAAAEQSWKSSIGMPLGTKEGTSKQRFCGCAR
jgi:hypothetical protein